MSKITNQDFAAAKKAARINGFAKDHTGHRILCDQSASHTAAYKVLKTRCPLANEELLWDMAWGCVMAAR